MKKDEHIARLSNSDQELKEAMRISSEAEAQKSANEERSKELDERETKIEKDKIDYKEKCDETVREVESQCQKDNDEAARRLENAKGYEQETKEMKENEEAHIRKAAEIITAGEIERLNRKSARHQKAKDMMLEGKYAFNKHFAGFVFMVMILFCGCFGAFSGRLRADAVSIWKLLIKTSKIIYRTIDGWGRGTEKWLKGTDSFDWFASSAYILIIILSLAVLIGLIGFLIFLYVRFLLDYNRFNDVCKWIMVGTGFLCIAASWVDIPILAEYNLIFIWLAIQAIVPIVQTLYLWRSGKLRDKTKRSHQDDQNKNARSNRDEADQPWITTKLKENWALISGVVVSAVVLVGGLYLIGRFILMKD